MCGEKWGCGGWHRYSVPSVTLAGQVSSPGTQLCFVANTRSAELTELFTLALAVWRQSNTLHDTWGCVSIVPQKSKQFVQKFTLATIKLTGKHYFYGKFRSVGEGGFLHADFDSVSSRAVVLHFDCTLKSPGSSKKV